jgi:hypothetical protein
LVIYFLNETHSPMGKCLLFYVIVAFICYGVLVCCGCVACCLLCLASSIGGAAESRGRFASFARALLVTMHGGGSPHPTMSADEITQLPIVQFKRDVPDNLGAEHLPKRAPAASGDAATDNDAEICSICLVALQDGDSVYNLKCPHHFHTECGASWFRINATCPICRARVA